MCLAYILPKLTQRRELLLSAAKHFNNTKGTCNDTETHDCALVRSDDYVLVVKV